MQLSHKRWRRTTWSCLSCGYGCFVSRSTPSGLPFGFQHSFFNQIHNVSYYPLHLLLRATTSHTKVWLGFGKASGRSALHPRLGSPHPVLLRVIHSSTRLLLLPSSPPSTSTPLLGRARSMRVAGATNHQLLRCQRTSSTQSRNSTGEVAVRRRGSRLFRPRDCRNGGLLCSCVGGPWPRTRSNARSGGAPYVCAGPQSLLTEIRSDPTRKVGEGRQTLASGVLACLY